MTTTERPALAPVVTTTRRRLVLALLAVAQLMLVLDVTVVNVALPDIGAALHLGRDTVPWVLTSYTLAFGGLMLLGGRIADEFGARRVALGGLTLFVLSSLICGLAGGGAQLLAGRAAQGVGAALLSPAALALVLRSHPGPERGAAMAVWSALSGVGAALGVVLGGVLTSGAGWRWIFVINLPIGLAILVAIPLVTVADGRATGSLRGVDVPGAALVTAGTAAIIYGLVRAGSVGWGGGPTLAWLAGGALLWGAFIARERRVTTPLLAVGLLTRRPVAAGAFLMLVATGLLVGGFFVGSFALQRGEGYSALRVGLLFLPVALGTITGAHTAGRLIAHVDTRVVATTGLVLAACGFGAAVLWTDPAGIVLGLTLAALGVGATFVTAFTCSLADASASESGLRSAIVGTFHELGGALGVALLATAIGRGLTARAVGVAGFDRPFLVGALIALGAAPLAVVLVPAVRRPGAAGHSPL